VTVTRAGKVLPIAQVPNLKVGDRLWIHPDFPAGESARYLLIAAFLRGATNPPPEDWFIKAETWTKQVREEGIVIPVPPGAEQVVLFLAPQTGGDFNTLRAAVRGKPGAFVRASQDLNQASLDRSRLDEYLSAVKQTSATDVDELHERSTLLARSLNIKLDQQCFDKPSEQQAPCLMQNPDQLVLDDGHSESMVAALTSGPNSDLIGQISSTKLAGGGAYSPYVGAVVDVARIMGGLHTAAYQYIPALAFPARDRLNLKLNNPPSFRKPMSVLVVGLPGVEAEQLPPLRAVDTKQVFCLQKPGLALPVEGAPLVFSTQLAHDFVLHLQDKTGLGLDLPAAADASRGGVVIDTHSLHTTPVDAEFSGTLRGYWGFEPLNGPDFLLRSAQTTKWEISTAEKNALMVGRQQTLHLQAGAAACVEQVTVQASPGKAKPATWKLLKPDELEVQVPLQDAAPGPLTVSVRQFGMATADEVLLQAYSPATHLDSFGIHAGDQEGVLQGAGLDQVASLALKGISFAPKAISSTGNGDELHLATTDSQAAATLHAGEKLAAQVSLKDGRVLDVPVTVGSARPRVSLLTKSVLRKTSAPSPIRLANHDDLPQDGRLSFFLKAVEPATFPLTEKIEVATADGFSHIQLSVAEGDLVLQDSQTVVAALDPLKSFGLSAFGPLRFRPVSGEGVAGDWQPLANLVRIPMLKEVRCPDDPQKPCTLLGTGLFLLDSVAVDPEFTHSVTVPAGYANTTLDVPRPNGPLLYLKLRDDPSAANAAVLPVLPE
jgi:hypothetical protein